MYDHCIGGAGFVVGFHEWNLGLEYRVRDRGSLDNAPLIDTSSLFAMHASRLEVGILLSTHACLRRPSLAAALIFL